MIDIFGQRREGIDVQVGISLPNNWGVSNVRSLIDIACYAEKAGFSSVWTSEHLIHNSYVESRLGKQPYYHPLPILSAVAALTSRILLGTSVIVLPFHNPFDLAKYFATLDHISGGRTILGVGVGNIPEEFNVMGVPWEKRGALTDEAIAIIQTLWTSEAAEHHGANWSFSDVHTSPKPLQSTIPVWVGGASKAALRRVATVAQGWSPISLTPEEFQSHAHDVRSQAIAAGRDSKSIEMCMRVNITYGEASAGGASVSVPFDDPEATRDILARYEAAGATHMVFALNTVDATLMEETVRGIAGAVPNLMTPARPT